jgi:hypothetical protein
MSSLKELYKVIGFFFFISDACLNFLEIFSAKNKSIWLLDNVQNRCFWLLSVVIPWANRAFL